jgi:hypothetical protein
MEMKNAVAVCLISLFSSTLVLLIARVLDMQAASRIEPQLGQIVEELKAIHKAGGISASANNNSESDPVTDGLMVYYFHSNTRCPTCQSIESQSQETVQIDFASQLKNGEMAWKILNYEESAVAPLAKKFEIQMPVVVLAKMKGGQIADWKRLDQVWALVGDKAAFTKYVHEEIEKMLDIAKQSSSKSEPASIPIPDNNAPSIPVPESTENIPLPE